MKTSPLPLLLLLALWGVAVAAAGSAHLLFHVPTLAFPLLVAGLTIGFGLAVSRLGAVRDGVAGLSLRLILALNVERFLGFSFLWLSRQGRLPVEFADRAGWGDVAVAAGALVLLFVPDGPFFRRALWLWNLLGMADLFVAVGTAGWLNLSRPGAMIAMADLPMVLVPLWLVPIYLVGHITIFRRLGRPCATRETLAPA
jgi:hypothetical protein